MTIITHLTNELSFGKRQSVLEFYSPASECVSMFGLDRFSVPFKARSKFLAVLRQWFSGYQPSRTYMRGAGPASRNAMGRHDGIDAGKLT